MRNLAKSGVVLTLFILLVGVFFYERHVGAVTLIANVSQENNIQENQLSQEENQIPQDNQIPQQDQDTNRQTAKKAESNEVETQDIDVDVEDEAGNMRSFRATAYCLRGRTASGGSVRRGIVAADSRVLPLGTRITMDAGKYSGTYLVADTGGAVRGNKLDVWVPSCSEARTFGRRTVKVKVHGKRRKK